VVLSVAEALDPALLATIERERAFVLFQGPEEARVSARRIPWRS
jgi:hypothetical protein